MICAQVAAERCVDGDAQRCADVAWALGRAAPVVPPAVRRRATSVPTFAPAATYVGRRPGYKFTAGARGVGYYLDYPAQPLPTSFEPVGEAPDTALHAAQLAWFCVEIKHSRRLRVLNCHVNLTPSTRDLLDGVAVWVLHHSRAPVSLVAWRTGVVGRRGARF